MTTYGRSGAAVAHVAHVRDVLAREAARVDAESAFPVEGLAALRESGLMGLLVPREHGGMGENLARLSVLAREFAGACTSTALVWAMHCQQVAVLAHWAPRSLAADLLPAIAAGRVYVASVTTERRKGGDLAHVEAALEWDGDDAVVRRVAPVVTGGEHADAFLVTMRRHPEADLSDVVLVYGTRDQLRVECTSAWDAMGMRGTGSVGMEIEGRVPADQVLQPEVGFAALANARLIPAGHVAWASCWLGAAERALREFVAQVRDRGSRKKLGPIDDRFAVRLGRIRAHVDVAEAVLERHVARLDAAWEEQPEGRPDHGLMIRTNDVKVLVSEASLTAVDELIELAGMRLGYARTSPVPLERVFRDLRSASLMYPNEQLLAANGRLALFEGAGAPGKTAG